MEYIESYEKEAALLFADFGATTALQLVIPFVLLIALLTASLRVASIFAGHKVCERQQRWSFILVITLQYAIWVFHTPAQESLWFRLSVVATPIAYLLPWFVYVVTIGDEFSLTSFEGDIRLSIPSCVLFYAFIVALLTSSGLDLYNSLRFVGFMSIFNTSWILGTNVMCAKSLGGLVPPVHSEELKKAGKKE